MGLFRRNDPPPPVIDVTQKEWKRLQRDYARLEAKVDGMVERWDHFHDMTKKLTNRLQQRDRRAEKALEEAEEVPERSNGGGQVSARIQRIYARRGRAIPRIGS